MIHALIHTNGFKSFGLSRWRNGLEKYIKGNTFMTLRLLSFHSLYNINADSGRQIEQNYFFVSSEITTGHQPNT